MNPLPRDPHTGSAIRVANAPCSWGVLEFELGGETLHFARVLDEMRATGYAGTELGDWGFMPTEPSALHRELEARGLALVGGFVPVALASAAAHEEGEARAVRTAFLMAEAAGTAPFIVLADDNGKDPIRTRDAGRVAPGQGLDDARWETFCRGANRIAAAVRRSSGLRTVFHHHCAGFVETPAEIERLLAGTDPALVGLCLDTGHFRFGGGGDLVAWHRRFAPRIWHVHFKDVNPEVCLRSRQCGWDYFESLRHGLFCEVGTGDVNFAALRGELERSGYSGWIVVEQDVLPGMGTPGECAGRNRAFLRTLGL